MKNEYEGRLKRIIEIAYKLGWVSPNSNGYPLMQLSEVEKCMIAMVSDEELYRMVRWFEESQNLKTNKQEVNLQ
jgi:hypothetical protein